MRRACWAGGPSERPSWRREQIDGLPITSARKSAGINTCLTHCLPISSSNLGSVVSRLGAGPCGGMDAATEPPGTDSRRVPTPDAAPRRRPTPPTGQSCTRHPEFHANASVCCGRLHACRCRTRRKYVRVGSGAASTPLKVPRRHPRKYHQLLSVTERNAEGMLGAWCRVQGRDRVAAWMPPPSLQGRIHGVSRHRMRRRATDRPACRPLLRTPSAGSCRCFG
ncbi:UNVERIFIED_ORG: hypothetical protein FHR68_002258 [Xanthomonas campestris]